MNHREIREQVLKDILKIIDRIKTNACCAAGNNDPLVCFIPDLKEEFNKLRRSWGK